MNRALAYWLCQLGGWSGFLGINLATQTTINGKIEGDYAILLSLACGTGLLLTHFFRWAFRPREWIHLGLLRLFPRIFLPALLGGVFLTVFVQVASSAIRVTEHQNSATLQMVLLQIVSWVLVLCGWGTVYLAIHFFEAFQQAHLDRWQAQVRAREAELKLLKNQLNPHFLFNCLNSLRGMISEDPEKAQMMVTQLASLLRYALQSSSETVPLREEMRAVRNYLELEATRLEERLRYDLQIDESCLQLAVPPLLIQSLVENGIKHGVANRKDGGRLSVIVSRNGDRYEIDVINSGNRISGEKAGGMGLRNASSRLGLIYGEEASLELSQIGADEIRARVTIPLEGTGHAYRAG